MKTAIDNYEGCTWARHGRIHEWWTCKVSKTRTYTATNEPGEKLPWRLRWSDWRSRLPIRFATFEECQRFVAIHEGRITGLEPRFDNGKDDTLNDNNRAATIASIAHINDRLSDEGKVSLHCGLANRNQPAELRHVPDFCTPRSIKQL